MQDISTVRNVAIFGHGKSGKTSLAEALLFTAGKTTRLGKVDDGSSVLDFEPEELKRKITINTSFHQYTWKKHTVFLLDTPGDDNFINESKFATQVADCALFVIEGPLAVKYQTEKIASFVAERNLPTVIFINKMDKDRADFDQAIADIKSELPFKVAITCLPIGAEADFKGVVDLVKNKAYLFDGDKGKLKETPIPAEMQVLVASHRETLMEDVAETDDALIEKFLEEGELTEADLKSGLSKATKSGLICPVCVGAAPGNNGTEMLLNIINELMPAPNERPARSGIDPKTGNSIERKPLLEEPFSAQVFKTMADPYAGRLTIFRVFSGTLNSDSFYNATKETNEKFGQTLIMEGKESKQVDSVYPGMIAAVSKLKETVTGDTLCTKDAPILFEELVPVKPNMSFAVSTSKKDDEDKLFSSITKMLEEDPTLKLTRELQTKEILLSGIGQIHIEVTGEKIKRKFGVEMALRPPKVPYKETIKGKARVQGKHKKQSGGRGQFADSWIEMEPMPRGGGYEFQDKIVGGVIPKNYIPAVDKGIQEAMIKGVLAGYPTVDLKVSLVDGSFHNVDSSEMAFKISGSLAFKKAVTESQPVLLEPIMSMQIRMPKDCVGDVIGDLNGRRGKVMGMDSEGKSEIVSAQAPMAEILQYSPELTSITGGRGSFDVEFSHYEEMPGQLAEKVIAAAKAENE
ncbi:MAG: elongation factor G [Proteobacteria bacterium]|nr:elongation factor G [Pseudomonadota bacterium]MBU1709802.1 elongation factor G [Pseudomonadota bacterium]